MKQNLQIKHRKLKCNSSWFGWKILIKSLYCYLYFSSQRWNLKIIVEGPFLTESHNIRRNWTVRQKSLWGKWSCSFHLRLGAVKQNYFRNNVTRLHWSSFYSTKLFLIEKRKKRSKAKQRKCWVYEVYCNLPHCSK